MKITSMKMSPECLTYSLININKKISELEKKIDGVSDSDVSKEKKRNTKQRKQK